MYRVAAGCERRYLGIRTTEVSVRPFGLVRGFLSLQTLGIFGLEGFYLCTAVKTFSHLAFGVFSSW